MPRLWISSSCLIWRWRCIRCCRFRRCREQTSFLPAGIGMCLSQEPWQATLSWCCSECFPTLSRSLLDLSCGCCTTFFLKKTGGREHEPALQLDRVPVSCIIGCRVYSGADIRQRSHQLYRDIL